MNSLIGHRPMLNPRLALIAAAIAAVVLTTACAEKPPGCADPTVGHTLQELFVGDVLANVTSHLESAGNNGAKNQEWLRDYMREVRLNLRNVGVEGYDGAARRHVCAADFVLTTAVEGEHGFRSRYSIQAIEGSAAPRIVIEGYAVLVEQASSGFNFYYERRRAGAPIRQ